MYRGVGIAYGSLGEGEGWAWMWMSRKGKEDGEVDGREDKYFLGLMHLFEKQAPHFYKRPTNNIPTAARGSPRLALLSLASAVAVAVFRVEMSACQVEARPTLVVPQRVPRFFLYVSEARSFQYCDHRGPRHSTSATFSPVSVGHFSSRLCVRPSFLVPPNPRNARVSKPKRTLKVPTGYFESVGPVSERPPYGVWPI